MMEEAFMDISKTLGVEPLAAADYLKTLPKKQDMVDLLAQIDCMLKENGDLKGQPRRLS